MCALGHNPFPEWVGWVIIAVNTVNSFLYGYEDTIIYLKVAVEAKPEVVEPMSRIVGLCNQIGNIVGSVTSFLLVTKGAIQ